MLSLDVPSSLQFLDQMKQKKFHVYDKPGAINIVGFRSKEQVPDKFNDYLAVYLAKSGGVFEYDCWPITTMPGIPWLRTPMNRKGTAVLVPGQYRNSYRIGLYHGYRALRQVGPVRVFRDNNLDGEADMENVSIEEGFFGIHIHRAGLWSKIVGVSSAGCQVFQRRRDFDEFMSFCEEASTFHKNSFSYTLLDQVNGN